MDEQRTDRRPYLPILALPYWDVIGSFVDAAVDSAATSSKRTRTDLYAAATPFVLWCWQARGTPLEQHRIFRRSMVEQFIHLGMPGAPRGSRATLRSALWAMTEVLNPEEMLWRPRPIPRSDPIPPYTTEAIAELYSWANTQGTPGRSRNALALLCLGLGAGLATRELLDVRTSDISIDITGGRAQARVVVWRSRPRVVPFLPDWVRSLQTVLAGLGPDDWLFRQGRSSTSSGQVTDFLSRSRTTLDVRPARMRTTWLVRHLTDGTPPDELLRISGLSTYAALDKLSRFVPDPGPSENFPKEF